MLYETFEKIYALEKQGKTIVKLNVGEPDWNPPKDAVNKAVTSLKQNKIHYASGAGESSLRERIASLHGCKAENVVIVPGSKWGIYALLKLHLGQDDNVIVFSPHWTAYEGMCKSVGAQCRRINLSMENKWKLDFVELEKSIDAQTTIIILNSPANPTSKLWSENEERELIEFAKRKGIVVLADDAYRDLCFDKRKDRMLDDGIVIAHTFSKTFGMTGWRIGYVIAEEKMAKKLVSLNQITITNVPVFIQKAAEQVLEKKEKIAEKARTLCKRRAQVAEKIVRGKMTFTKPDAGFYIFPKLPDTINGMQFLDTLLEKGVAVAPGGAFGDYTQHVRISLCKNEELLKEALGKMVETIEK